MIYKLDARKARIDALRSLHQIICLGIEGIKTVRDNRKYDLFFERDGTIFKETSAPCFNLALMQKQFHLQIKTKTVPIASDMQRLLTGFAVALSLRHGR